FVNPSPPGSGEQPPIVFALDAACDVEEEMEDFLEEALAKLDGISRKLDQKLDVPSECVLEGSEWYQGGKMFWLDVDEVKKALAQATTITDAGHLHVEQAVNAMSPKQIDRLRSGPDRPIATMELKCRLLTCIAYLGRFGPEGTRQAFHMLGFASTQPVAEELCPFTRRDGVEPGAPPNRRRVEVIRAPDRIRAGHTRKVSLGQRGSMV
ncbi:hypothetical protein KC316_g16359, partial [Hortaea werneckii]